MHIKQLTIHGFKSYRDQTIVDPFSPQLNVVVGRNGSGKSNFFAAIRFLLHDAYTRAGQEERQALLHEGGVGNSVSAYVEMVFDNSDHRFPTGRDEVVLRRTIGLKKDEYSLDRRPVSKQDVANLLQSAGFSRSNPYFIVPQGRITALCNAKDEERLELLKEVAGTRVYEEHREESLKILEETEGKREKIASLLKLIDERLAELEAERESLQRHQDLERRRRTIQQAMGEQEEAEAAQKLQQLEQEHAPLLQRASQQRGAQETRLAQIASLRQQAEDRRQRLAELQASLEQEPEVGDLEQAGLDPRLNSLTLSGLTAQLAQLESEQVEHQQALRSAPSSMEMAALEAQLRQEREAAEERLAQCSRELEQLLAEKAQLSTQLTSLQTERDGLRARGARAQQFKTAAERDRWLKGQIDLLQQQLASAQQQHQQLGEECVVAEQRLSDLQRERTDATLRDTKPLQRQLSDAVEARRELWRVQAKLEGSLKSLEAEAERCHQGLVEQASGLASCLAVKEAARLLGIPVHGAVFELFHADPVFHAAIEAVAGASGLWQLVVDNDVQAARLLDLVKREGLGRVSIVPLNRLRLEPDDPTQPYPEGVVSLISQVQIRSEVCAGAVRQVLGRAVLCQSLSVAAGVARSHRVTAVTLAGDRVDRKGALFGGHVETAGSKGLLSGAQRLAELQERQAEHARLQTDLVSRLEQAELNVQRAQAALQSPQQQRPSGWLDAEIETARQLLSSRQRGREQVQREVEALGAQVASLQTELGSPLRTLGEAEQSRLKQLVRETEAIHQRLEQVSPASLEAEQAKLHSLLSGSLALRHAELCRWQSLHDRSDASAELETLRHLRAKLISWRTERSQHVAALEAELRSLEGSLSSLVEGEEGEGDRMEVAMERYLARRAVLVSKREAAMANARSGPVDGALLAELQGIPVANLLNMLHACNEQLRLHGPVNRRAADQWATYAKQGEGLRTRHAELERSAQAIRDFIQVLEGRRGEALHRTFGQVAEQFERLWEQLVPAGKGELLMIRGGQESPAGELEGVAIRVSFNSRMDEGLLTGQLSGGQKSLVALCLILAIQQTDPAPFYLFDEIDANLDGAYRASVARLLASISAQPTQFIVTTFRPEFVREANQWYGVTHSGRVSRIETITQEAAMAFVEHSES